MIFNQMGVISAKVGVIKQILATCALPPTQTKILYETLVAVIVGVARLLCW